MEKINSKIKLNNNGNIPTGIPHLDHLLYNMNIKTKGLSLSSIKNLLRDNFVKLYYKQFESNVENTFYSTLKRPEESAEVYHPGRDIGFDYYRYNIQKNTGLNLKQYMDLTRPERLLYNNISGDIEKDIVEIAAKAKAEVEGGNRRE